MARVVGWRVRGALAALLVGLAVGPGLLAHDLERTTVHIDIAEDGTFVVRLAHDPAWLLLRMESFTGGPTVSSADVAARDARLEALAPGAIDRVVLWVDGTEVRPTTSTYRRPPVSVPAGELALAAYELRGAFPLGATSVRWYYGMVADPYPLTITLADGSTTTEWVGGDAWSTSLPLGGPFTRQTPWSRLREYFGLGFTHILPRGLDHMLFVAGLFLLSARLRPVLLQVTTFTLAHSITLGLAAYGVVTLPPRLVEPLIAVSIVYVAVENLRARMLTPWRVGLVFLFGLLHGLGFASVLAGLHLPRAEMVLGSFGFNVGVEAGQLAVIAGLALAVGWWRHRPWYRQRIVAPLSLVIAGIGTYWTIARVVAR